MPPTPVPESAAPLVTAVVSMVLALWAGFEGRRGGTRRRDFVILALLCAYTYLFIFLKGRLSAQVLSQGAFSADHLRTAIAIGTSLIGPAWLDFLFSFLRNYRVPRRDVTPALWVAGGLICLLNLVAPLLTQSTAQAALHIADALLVLCLVWGIRYIHGLRQTATARMDRVRLATLQGFASLIVVLLGVEAVIRLFAGRVPQLVPMLPLGSLGVATFLYFLRDSLVRARLLDAREILSQLAIFGLMAGLMALVYPTLIQWTNALPTEIPQGVDTVLAAVVILLLHDPLRQQLQRWFQPNVLRRTGDIKGAMQALERKLPGLIEPEAIAGAVIAALRESGHIERAAVYLWDDRAETFQRMAVMPPDAAEDLPTQISPTAALADAFEELPQELEALERQAVHGSPEKAAHARSLIGVLHDMRMDLFLPLRGGERTAGWIGLRRPEVTPPWVPIELDALRSAAERVSLALDNTSAVERLKERDRLAALGRMAAGLAHEIRNPLGAIKGAAQLLQGTEIHDPDDREMLGILVEESERLGAIVGQFLDYARPLTAEVATIDLEAWLRQIGKLIRAAGLPEEVTLDVLAPPPATLVEADGEKLRQVAINLVRNAVEAVGPQGHISIGARARTRDSSEEPGRPIGWRMHRGRLTGNIQHIVEFWVDDDGPGISAEHRDSLFVPFFTTKKQGTGLGLPACERLVRSMNGRIEISTAPGRGTRFTVQVPDQGAEDRAAVSSIS